MIYKSLRECVTDLEKHGHLVRVSEAISPDLEMAEIQRRVYQKQGPALLFENVIGSPFPAVSNLYGTLARTRFIFRSTLQRVHRLMKLKADAAAALKAPWRFASVPRTILTALPKRVKSGPVMECATSLDQLPQIKSWPDDGGPFILLPQVFSEDPAKPGIMHSNVGMYRIQLAGNDYLPNKEVGLHYQIRRDIGIHHTNALRKGEPFRVSVFVGGPPSHTFAAVMPLPEGMPEVAFAGALAGRRFHWARDSGNVVSVDADFCITGTVIPGQTKPEGPFGDHVGYYSLQHPFPVLRVEKVYHRKDAIWPFTVVGRPPQEDTSFGKLVHEITDPLVPTSIPGVEALHAVDAAGVHPLLLAIGRERYVPYERRRPMELLTLANAILGFGHCSLAKYLFISAWDDNPDLDINDIQNYFVHIFERVDWRRDLHFQTNTTIDTLDYTGSGLNKGSKVIIAAAGEKIRNLSTTLHSQFSLPGKYRNPVFAMPGILIVEGPAYRQEQEALKDVDTLNEHLQERDGLEGIAIIVLTEDSEFAARTISNFLWVAFTRSNPATDIYGIGSFIRHKHWGCTGPIVIDARLKPHHAPPLIEDPAITKKVDQLAAKGGCLHGIL